MLNLNRLRFHPLKFSRSVAAITKNCVQKHVPSLPCTFNPPLMTWQGSFTGFRLFGGQTEAHNSRKLSTDSDLVQSVDTMKKEEAIQFLQDSWQMGDVESRLLTDRESFLNKLIQTFYERVPFQFLILMKQKVLPLNEQEMPTIEDIDRACMSGLGGNCGVVNVFAYRLLKALGFSAHLCGAALTANYVGVHLAVIVKDLVNSGDVHYVDCGSSQPAFQAISLNFNEESPVYQASHLEYKFIKRDDMILRMLDDGDMIKRNDPPIEGLDFILGKWRRFIEFAIQEDFEQKTLKTLWKYFDFRYGPQNLIPRISLFPGGKACMIMGYNLLLGQEDRKLKKIKLQSMDEILQAYQQYFPSIDESLVYHAYSIWEKNRL